MKHKTDNTHIYKIMEQLEVVSMLDEFGNECEVDKDVPNCNSVNVGYPDCHCNHCLDGIQKMNGKEKGKVYFNARENQNVITHTFCPLPNCADVFWKATDWEGKQYDWGSLQDLHEAR